MMKSYRWNAMRPPTFASCRRSSLALCSLQSLATAETCETRSAATRVAVLELYTSEGCSSCPPADRWVSSLPAKGFTPDRVIPLAFHVDYWDELGWPDRMAKAQYSARQRMQAGRHRASVVYTPQVLLNGADYRSSFSDIRLDERIKEIQSAAGCRGLVPAAKTEHFRCWSRTGHAIDATGGRRCFANLPGNHRKPPSERNCEPEKTAGSCFTMTL